jgi:hypothetical protein
MPPRFPDDSKYGSLGRMHSSFSRALPATKRWAMAVDFENNVKAALEREKNEK